MSVKKNSLVVGCSRFVSFSDKKKLAIIAPPSPNEKETPYKLHIHVHVHVHANYMYTQLEGHL